MVALKQGRFRAGQSTQECAGHCRSVWVWYPLDPLYNMYIAIYQYSFLESTQGKSKDSDIVDCCACIPSIHIPASWILELFSSFFSLMVFFQLSESNDLQRDFNWGRGTIAISWHGRHKLLKAPCTCFTAVSCRVQDWFQRHLFCPMWHFWLMLIFRSIIDRWNRRKTLKVWRLERTWPTNMVALK